MSRDFRVLLGLGFLVGVCLPAKGIAQEPPEPCEAAECCRRAEGAELYGQVLAAESGQPLPGATSRSLSFRLEDPGRVELSFEIRGVPAGLDSLRAAAAASREAAAPGRVVGRIEDAGSGRPVAEATVTLEPSGMQALTDRRGQFEIPEAPAGEGELAIHHVAYGDQTVDVDVPSELTLSLEIDLPPKAIEVEPIDVRVEATIRDPYLELRGYYERKRRGELLGMGKFLDGPDIQIRGARASHVLSTMPGLRTMSGQLSGFVRLNRDATSLHGGPCLPAIYLDGHKIAGSTVIPHVADIHHPRYRFWNDYKGKVGGRRGLNTLVSPASLAAVGVYTGLRPRPESSRGAIPAAGSSCFGPSTARTPIQPTGDEAGGEVTESVPGTSIM